MALDGTYEGLKASIADFLGRGDLAAAIPDFIILAEAQMARRFAAAAAAGSAVPRQLLARADAVLDAGQEFVALPGRFIGARTFVVRGEPDGELAYLSPETFLAAKKTLLFDMGARPRYYTVVGSEFQLLPVPAQAFEVEVAFLQVPLALGDGNAENWVLQQYPDIYLYGALTQSAPYLDNDARMAAWGALFTQAIADACNAEPLPTDKVALRCDDMPARFVMRME
jgi:hypothetical protein